MVDSFNMRLIAALFMVVGSALSATPAIGQLFSQINLTFDSQRPYSYRYDRADHALTLMFQHTRPSELQALEHYDERLIKRIILKDYGPQGTEAKLVLRDRNVRALIRDFNEPYRIVVDLFDADYQQPVDPETGLPLAVGSNASSPNGDPAVPSSQLDIVDPPADDQTMRRAPVAPDSQYAEGGDPVPAEPVPNRRELVNPLPNTIQDPNKLASAVQSTPGGAGKGWDEYPKYIYRLRLADQISTARAKPARITNQHAKRALTSVQAMAQFAGNLYDYGHEGRALLAYQQVLHRDPTLFDRDPLHLWKFSETHLGQGNLTLARGYYEALLQKHPASPLAQYARLRILDIGAIRMGQQKREGELSTLAPRLNAIRVDGQGELAALAAIRNAWWQSEGSGIANLPKVSVPIRNQLATAYAGAEDPKTAFHTASIVLADMARSDRAWQRTNSAFVNAYFNRFNGRGAEPYRSQLRQALGRRLDAATQAKVQNGQLASAVDDYESMPNLLKVSRTTPGTAWAMGEAYRELNQPEKALEQYQKAAKGSENGPDRFKALFWTAVMAGQISADAEASNQPQQIVDRHRRIASGADRSMGASWNRLTQQEQSNLQIAYKSEFERTLNQPARLSTPAEIVLDAWDGALNTRLDVAAGGDNPGMDAHYSPSASAVALLANLSKRFKQLGKRSEQRRAQNLIRRIKPADLGDDQTAKNVWVRHLVELAEDYRNAAQYLDAGRVYRQVGEDSENWEGRAEALYKAGLLLYRGGRREEALASLQAAAADGNNIMYSKLARERLSQLD